MARRERRALISADTDFGTLLVRSGDDAPSMVLFRREIGRRPDEQLRVVLDNLDQLSDALEAGCIVVLTERLIRVRRLPLLP